MRLVDLALVVAATAGPLAALGPWFDRARQQKQAFWPGIRAIALGAAGAFPALAVRWAVGAYAGVHEPRMGVLDPVALAFAFLVLAPLDEALRLGAATAALPELDAVRPYDRMRGAIGAALGFASVFTAVRLVGIASSSGRVAAFDVARALLDLIAHVSFSSLWGFALGRSRRRGFEERSVRLAFVAAAGLSSTTTYLLYGRGPGATVAAAPLVLLAVFAALVARRDLLRVESMRSSARLSRLLPVAPPTVDEIEAMLRRKPGQNVALWRIGVGALVTLGSLLAGLVIAVVVGRRFHVDFAAIDRGGAGDAAVGPLVLLGICALGAFPVAGFVTARATTASSVLEPALGASVAIVTCFAIVGATAPVAVVFALAILPVAFALTCAGAWTGIAR